MLGRRRIIPLVSGAIVPPLAAFLLLPIHFVASYTPLPTPTITSTQTPIPTLTSTPSPTPTKIPLPTKTPTPTPIPVTSQQLDEWFTKYSNHYSIERSK